MKSVPSLFRAGSLVIAFVVAERCFALAQESQPRHEAVAVIEIENVPLSTAIQLLARQMDFNYILDPAVQGSLDPLVTIRWENATAEQAFKALLAEHRLAITANPATSIAHIRTADHPIKPMTVPPIRIGSNGAIRLIEMDKAPVIQVITNLAAQTHLKITLDPKVMARFDPLSPSSPLPQGSRRLSVRWKDVTAAQALLAVLDNFDLAITEGADGAAWHITERPEVPSERAPTESLPDKLNGSDG